MVSTLASFATYRGWQQLRQDDLGPLWEHFVLNEIMARWQSMKIGYWRDKHGHEIDFIVAGRKGAPLAVECKWSASGNVVAAQDVDRSYSKTYGDIEVRFESLRGHGA